MGFGVFSAQGTVIEINPKTTNSGSTFVTMVLKTGTFKGQQGPRDEVLEVVFRGNNQGLVQDAIVGSQVMVSGFLSCYKNKNGYFNVSLSANKLDVLASTQTVSEPQQEQPYSNSDIPF